jgi:hypothetical protein
LTFHSDFEVPSKFALLEALLMDSLEELLARINPQLVAGAELNVMVWAEAGAISCESNARGIKRRRRPRMEFILAI